MLKVAMFIALAGCDVVYGLDRLVLPDAAIADDTAPVDAQMCFGTAPVVCLLALPTTALVIDADQSFDTTSLCPVYDDPLQSYCVLAATDITISKRMRATGSKPLVFVATGTITISGEVDASSKRGLARGPGTEPAECAPINPIAAGGGPGGTHGGRGGNGGPGAGGGIASAPSGSSGFATGCTGSAGARNSGGQGGEGGAGGGAVLLIASLIRIDGTVNASGAGGSGGISNAITIVGGGGGGAGGTISLDAAMIALGPTARVFANGGGGGEGAAAALGTGSHGADPGAATAGTRAAGGMGIYVIEGDGGSGAGGTNLDGVVGGDGVSAGGGGGGGAGVIWITGTPMTELGAIVSPAPTPPATPSAR